MKEIEKQLSQIPLAEVPASLDRRVRETLSTYRSTRHTLLSRPVPLWACALACLVFLGLGIWWAQSTDEREIMICQSMTWIVAENSHFSEIMAPEYPPTRFFERPKTLVE